MFFKVQVFFTSEIMNWLNCFNQTTVCIPIQKKINFDLKNNQNLKKKTNFI